MQKKNKSRYPFRLITDEEMRQVNDQLSKQFGGKNKIASGSFELTEEGRKRYNITLNDWNTYKPVPMLERIGKIVKEAWKADEIYHNGIKIA